MVFISIPTEIKNGRQSYSQCSMYIQNYTEIAQNWDYLQSTNYKFNVSSLLQTQSCQFGWIYDKKTFASTIVTEVSLLCLIEIKIILI